MVGEVWICSGQSNMAMSVQRVNNAAREIEKADYPKIRLFSVARQIGEEPMVDCKGNWLECSPESVSGFSAVAYFFGRDLNKKLDVPIGLINTSWGGTVAEAWTRKEALDGDQDFTPIFERHQNNIDNYDKNMKQYEIRLKTWQDKVKDAKVKDKKPPRRPRKPMKWSQNSPAALYNGMIAPLIPFTIKGAIWYQGEANTARAWQYRKIFPNMITNWRRDWALGDFPFYFVQLAPFNYGPGRESHELREAQLMTLALKNTGMAVTMDIGNPKDIHPKNKQDVGKRLALWALAKTYGRKKLTHSGPQYKSMQVQGNIIRLTFDCVGAGLTAKNEPLTHFTIAAADKNFIPADARIDGETIIVSADGVAKPVAVRYAFTNAAQPNLFNKDGLPASSFRTDAWPGKTYEAR